MIKNFFSGLLDLIAPVFTHDYQWARQRVGGRWEKWWCDPCTSYVWLQFDCTNGSRPGGCFGRPSEVEIW